MHEIKIAEELSVIVIDKAREARLSVVEKVNVSFGQLEQIVPDIFEFAFREAMRLILYKKVDG
jgi:Zn finger protein HypA/HybF involved in hydrogenase expression